MPAASYVEDRWLQLLDREMGPGEWAVEVIEKGYFAVVRATVAKVETPAFADYHALEPVIPNFARTRAVYLDSGRSYGLAEVQDLAAWAGDRAAEVECGARHAFAVIDCATFRMRVRAAMESCGWTVEEAADNLKVSAGRFQEQLNLMREVTRMVLKRRDFGEASQSIVNDLRQRFARDAAFFARFQKSFEGYVPAVLGHFFVAYPEASCVALGWDYWQLHGHDPAEASRVFEKGLLDFQDLLQLSPSDQQSGLATAAWGRGINKN